MNAYGWQNAFGLASSRCEVRHENHPPEADAWATQDDTLSRQAGHGICKGLATAWVVAFLNGVDDSFDVNKFRAYFTDVLQFQGTYIKDFGKHIDSHLTKMIELKLNPGTRLIKKVESTTLVESDLPGYNWASYCSVWHHDISFGRRSGAFYIMEPNFGLFVYSSQANFISDAQSLIEARRKRKNKGPADQIGVWIYGKG